MADRPLLLFPSPAKISRSKKTVGFNSYHFPSHERQAESLSPKFDQLQKIFDQQRIEIQQNAVGIEPEAVLVLETIGNIVDFVNAARRIDGFEWLGEIEIDEIVPDENFYDEKDSEKPLQGRLYLIITNEKALKQMLSMWENWKKNSNIEFPWGLKKFKEIFKRLKDIRYWDIQDRLLDIGTIGYWEEDLKHDGDRFVKFEIELWFRKTEQRRIEAEKHIARIITQSNGRIISNCIINEIAYHAVIAELPAKYIQEIINDPHIELTKCDEVMFFRPTGQIASDYLIAPEETEGTEIGVSENVFPTGNPIVALLDGAPLSNHELLSERLIIDDPDDYICEYRSNERRHGTAMASLITHGDLNDNEKSPLQTPLYVRPIMKPDSKEIRSPRRESMPDTINAIDLIHRAVRRIFEADGQENAQAPSIKIINLSIGDSRRPFIYEISPFAMAARLAKR